MATERFHQELTAALTPDEIARRAEQGWKLVAVEWQREVPQTNPRSESVPFGLRIAPDSSRLEEDPREQEVLLLMMELTVQDGPYSFVALELNRRGYRTREGDAWTPISVFQMLPRLIEVGPKIFASQEWQRRRARLSATG